LPAAQRCAGCPRPARTESPRRTLRSRLAPVDINLRLSAMAARRASAPACGCSPLVIQELSRPPPPPPSTWSKAQDFVQASTLPFRWRPGGMRGRARMFEPHFQQNGFHFISHLVSQLGYPQFLLLSAHNNSSLAPVPTNFHVALKKTRGDGFLLVSRKPMQVFGGTRTHIGQPIYISRSTADLSIGHITTSNDPNSFIAPFESRLP